MLFLFCLRSPNAESPPSRPCGSDGIAPHQTNDFAHISARSGGYKSHLRNHIVKPKKISWLRTPEISRFRGFFSRLLAFSQPWGLQIQSAEKKISFQKNGSLQDVEQLSPAAKAQYPFLRAESATFRVAKAFCAPSALFSYFYLLNICVCLKGGSSSVTFIKRKIATAASTTG